MPPQPHRTLKYFYLRFIRLKGDPHTLAKGIAIGVFIGSTPTVPFHTVLTLSLALIFRAAKFPALVASMLVTNPLTYYLSWKIGNWLTPWDLSWERINTVKEVILSGAGFFEIISAFGKLSHEVIIAMLLGGIIYATPLALLGYIISYKFFMTVQKKRRDKHVLK